MKRHVFLTAVLASTAAAAAGFSQAATQAGPVAAVDPVFARWNASTPGCAVGVAVKGKPVLDRAYGMADLEREVENAPDTIFESGSVSKQFTAAVLLLLARDGKLSIDDAVRKYVPEVPDYGVPRTIRHMLTHTSGLRDWGSIAGIAGCPRTQRAHTHAHVLDIVARQKALNFTPGTNWSYTNTGYNLSEAFRPEAAHLAAYAGRYVSDEAETEFIVAREGSELMLKQRPDVVRRLRAVEKDVFAVPVVGTVTFRRDAEGRVTALSVRQDRVWDLRFSRVP